MNTKETDMDKTVYIGSVMAMREEGNSLNAKLFAVVCETVTIDQARERLWDKVYSAFPVSMGWKHHTVAGPDELEHLLSEITRKEYKWVLTTEIASGD